MRGIACMLLVPAAGLALGAGGDAELALGKALFTKGAVPACAICHTLKDAGATGQIGPPLDELQPSAERVSTALRQGIGVMPAYKDSLTETQIQALARYVSTASQRRP